jgi:hypothetical protein
LHHGPVCPAVGIEHIGSQGRAGALGRQVIAVGKAGVHKAGLVRVVDDGQVVCSQTILSEWIRVHVTQEELDVPAVVSSDGKVHGNHAIDFVGAYDVARGHELLVGSCWVATQTMADSGLGSLWIRPLPIDGICLDCSDSATVQAVGAVIVTSFSGEIVPAFGASHVAVCFCTWHGAQQGASQ